MRIGKTKAFALAFKNCAGVVAAMDLEQLFGEEVVFGNEANLEEAKLKLATVLRQMAVKMGEK